MKYNNWAFCTYCTEHILAVVDWYGKSSKINHFNVPRRGLSRILDGVAQNGMKHVELWKPLTNRKLSCENIIPVQWNQIIVLKIPELI